MPTDPPTFAPVPSDRVPSNGLPSGGVPSGGVPSDGAPLDALGPALTCAHEAARLRAALRRLPAQQRTVLALEHVEDLTPAQIAAVLGRTPSRVSQLRARALATLRAALRGSVRQAA